MIPIKSRRLKTFKLPKNLERLYKQAKCRDCTVVVTRMDFAKILGKFTKVKIQFETNTPKTRRNIQTSPNSRIRCNENGAIQMHRNAYNSQSAKNQLGPGKKSKYNDDNTRKTPNVLREVNRLNKPVVKAENDEYIGTKVTYYGVTFVSPNNKKKEVKSKINLDSLLPSIDKNVLPSEEWCIDYFPKNGEPKDDKIYDRIAAELEDLMYNEKTKNISDNKDSKNDEFPSILDILNDTKEDTDKTKNQTNTPNLESSDVEAMLLGKSKATDATPMDIDDPNTPSSSTENNKTQVANTIDENPQSPSILEKTEPVDVPVLSVAEKPLILQTTNNSILDTKQSDENDNTNAKNKNNLKTGVTQVIFKKTINGMSSKTVICPKNLNYSISIQGKSIELLGAPKFISSLEDLQVLLQIVEESELSSLYVFH